MPFRRVEGRRSERKANENDEGGAHTCLHTCIDRYCMSMHLVGGVGQTKNSSLFTDLSHRCTGAIEEHFCLDVGCSRSLELSLPPAASLY